MKEEVGRIKREFLSFIKSYGVIGVAIGIVMGQATAKIINVIVEALVMPIIGVILPGQIWQEAVIHLGKVNIKIGMIIAAIIDFTAIALAVFLFVKYILRLEAPKNK